MEDLSLEKISPTLSVYQQKGVFCYGTDAILLAKYVLSFYKSMNKKTMCDLCSGTGIIPLYICDKNPDIKAFGAEINENACTIANMSASISNLTSRYTQTNCDIKNVKQFFQSESFDFVTCNPPYMTADSGYMCKDDYKTIARHEILCNIDDVFKSAFYLLKTGGNLFIVYRSDRLPSLFKAACDNRFQIKELISFISHDTPSLSKLIVCRASKDASEGLKHYIYSTNDFLKQEI